VAVKRAARSLPEPPLNRVRWRRSSRIVRSVFPPIDLFEDIADPADWELLAAAEARTNPRVSASVGQLDRVPVNRRVGGRGASHVMAPFVHVSPDRPSRFSRGEFGVYYAGNSTEVALFETIYHHGRFMRRTQEKPGWASHFRELAGSVDARLHDIRDTSVFDTCLLSEDYTPAQDLAERLHAAGSNGIVYPSVRYPSGECIAAFWPDVVDIPRQGQHYAYHWNGERVDFVRNLSTRETFSVEAETGYE